MTETSSDARTASGEKRTVWQRRHDDLEEREWRTYENTVVDFVHVVCGRQRGHQRGWAFSAHEPDAFTSEDPMTDDEAEAIRLALDRVWKREYRKFYGRRVERRAIARADRGAARDAGGAT